MKSGGDIELALLNVRATPLDSVLPSPAELMFGRPIQTIMPSRSNIVGKEEIRNHIQESTDAQKSYADQHTRDLPPILSGQSVGGRHIIRNRVQLREVPSTPKNDITPRTPLRTPIQHPMEVPCQIPSSEKDVHTPAKGGVQQVNYGQTTRSGRAVCKPTRLVEEP